MTSFELTRFSGGDLGFWILLAVPCAAAIVAAFKSCFTALRTDGWPSACICIRKWGIRLLGLFLCVGSVAFFSQVTSVGYFTRIEIWRDALVLDFPWPRADVVLTPGELYDAKYSDERFRFAEDGAAVKIHSINGNFRSYVCYDRSRVRDAVDEITRFQKEFLSGTYSTVRAPLPRHRPWISDRASTVTGWILWIGALTIWLAAVVVAFRGLLLGLFARVFSVIGLIPLLVTVVTDTSKLHLLWMLPIAIVVSAFATVWIDVRPRLLQQRSPIARN